MATTQADREAYADIARDLDRIAAKLADMDTGTKQRGAVVDAAANLARRIRRL